MSLTMKGVNAVAKKAVMFAITGEAPVYSSPSSLLGIALAKPAVLRAYLPVAVAHTCGPPADPRDHTAGRWCPKSVLVAVKNFGENFSGSDPEEVIS
jgi:hypothetical protein